MTRKGTSRTSKPGAVHAGFGIVQDRRCALFDVGTGSGLKSMTVFVRIEGSEIPSNAAGERPEVVAWRAAASSDWQTGSPDLGVTGEAASSFQIAVSLPDDCAIGLEVK